MITFTPAFVFKASLPYEKDHGWDHEQAHRRQRHEVEGRPPLRRLAVVDVLLKVGNGLQVLRAGRGRRNDQHIVVLTNYATPDIRRKSIECGADAVFDKSTEIDPFLELCRQYSAE